MPVVSGYEALLQGRAFVLRTDRGVVRLRGADRATWLQGLVTNDVLPLTQGHRVYSAYLTPQGRMIADLWVVATDEALLLDVPASLAASLASRLDGLIFAEDVQVDDVSGTTAVCQVFAQGVAPVSPVEGAWVTPDDTYGVPAYAAYCPTTALPAWLAALAPECVEVGLDALDVLRVEAGVPRFLLDMTEDTIPLEAGIEHRAISFSKGCYIGPEARGRARRGWGRQAVPGRRDSRG
jgi:tRNA-modifying protein YgfZ